MVKSELEVEATVLEEFQGGQFLVELGNGHKVRAHICGKMRINKIRIILGDKVLVGLSEYDLTRGIIKYRYKS